MSRKPVPAQSGDRARVELLFDKPQLLVRLFGNVMSGVFMIGIVLSLAGLLVPIPLMALDLLTGAVQAYIFAILAMVFIAGAVSDGAPAEAASALSFLLVRRTFNAFSLSSIRFRAASARVRPSRSGSVRPARGS